MKRHWNRKRALVLILGPIPIVLSSIALSNWIRPERSVALTTNEAVHFGSGAGVASAAEPAISGGEQHPLTAACRETAERWRAALGDNCHAISRPPFVLAGDLSDEQLARWNHDTVAPAARAMKNCYFRVAPTAPITVLLFGNEASYNDQAARLFNERDISVYGYYKPERRTLVLNIATGGGTLVHELTHSLIDFDFPKAPDWFNEGLASLHEQCRFRDGDDGPWIEGIENWRLRGLQSAIRKQRLRSLESLISEKDFRGADEGINYAQARYLCLYLQRKNLLTKFYREFRANQTADPQGLATLKSLFPQTAWSDLDSEFQAWALTLQRD